MAIGNRNDKRDSSGCGENYVTKTGQTYINCCFEDFFARAS